MISLLSFEGKIRPAPYALWSIAAFFSQHLLILVLLQSPLLSTNWQFYILPLRSLATLVRSTEATLILALAYGLLVAWVLAALAFRRAADANVSEWIAAATIVPVVQIPAILFCVARLPAIRCGPRLFPTISTAGRSDGCPPHKA
jgi:uncharacterized membrane protein YhaH (DUF805 family)